MRTRPTPRTAARTAGLVVAVVLIAASLVASVRPAPARDAWQWSTGAGVLALDWGDLDRTPEASRGEVVVMQSWEYARIPQLRRDHPGIVILMYKDASAVVAEPESSTGRFPAGMGYDWVVAEHPSWLLRDRSGRILEWSDWRGLYPMNIGLRGYQQTWASNVLAELRAHQWDGVMLDDVLTRLSHPTVAGLTSTAIPDDAAQYAATSSFLSSVAPQIRRAGYLAVPNVSVEWDNWLTTMTDWTPYVSGWENEHFTNWPGSSDRFVDADWRWKLDLARWLAARDVPLLAVTYGPSDDIVGQTYHRATWLLTWNGRTGVSVYVPDQYESSHWLPAATRDVGLPAGAAVEVADGTWTRPFTRGVVVVNPTATTRTVDLGGSYDQGGHRVSAVRLAPTTAAILAR